MVTLLTVTCGLLEPTLAANSTQRCVERSAWLAWGSDACGNLVGNVSNAVGIAPGPRKSACETGPEPFNRPNFSQKFSAWLLPWLALISQLPSGGFEDLTPVLLAVGLPTLAAHSLALTVLGGRRVARRLSDIPHPNVEHAFRVAGGPRQAPLNITKDDGLLHSPVISPENDNWWEELAVWLDYSHTWSIAAPTSILWAFLAHLFIVIGAFTSLPPDPMAESGSSGGQSVGAVWLWPLPIVVG